jgi:hypothetical protein
VIREQIKIREKKLVEDEEEVKKQDSSLKELTTKIEGEMLVSQDQVRRFDEAQSQNEMLEKKQRENALKYAALE